MKTWKTPKLKRLAKAFLSLPEEAEMINFLRDLMTLDELDEISTRWQAAEMINKGTPYREIAEKTGLSTATVSRVAHWLKHGEGGYQAALYRKNEKKRK